MEDKIKITVEVNGKPGFLCDISEESLLNMRKADAEQRIPFARLASTHGGPMLDRLLIRITESIAEKIRLGDNIMAINLRDGEVMWSRQGGDVACQYSNIQDLTPKD